MDVIQSAAELFEALSKQTAGADKTFTPGFDSFLKPGLSEEELSALEHFHRIALPAEVRAFYGAYNLATVTGDDKPFFYGDYWMLGLQQAMIKKQMIGELAAEFFGDIAGSGEWLPFLQSESGYYLIDGFAASRAGNTTGAAPILFMYSGAEPELRFSGLAAMFDTFHDWLAEGALTAVDGRIASNDRADRKQMAEIAVRHNPGVEYWQDWL